MSSTKGSRQPVHTAALALGSNIGAREDYLNKALSEIRKLGAVTAVSGFINSAPAGYEEQADFLNGAAVLKTELMPEELLRELKDIERMLGRQKRFLNGPREIDIDIIFYDDLVLSSPPLTIPHPRAHERHFVLTPLSEIMPDYIHPVLGIKISEIK
ncbi:2-amino-4-hydroxy-6-hydroxymethyldihydropteridine diphosphokinase/dihydroneopterin aldolase [Parelusimicrobium proximum]|uniref:2-amino-4-hydroxy-6- hydroxymethyldihydropteridine diphosphokinase n=1 Tax=Parelusimicrobium proximum TaxID=3228953 RepID=UPI003D16B73C